MIIIPPGVVRGEVSGCTGTASLSAGRLYSTIQQHAARAPGRGTRLAVVTNNTDLSLSVKKLTPLPRSASEMSLLIKISRPRDLPRLAKSRLFHDTS